MRPVYQVADRLKIGCKRTLATLQWTLLSVLSGVIIGLVGSTTWQTEIIRAEQIWSSPPSGKAPIFPFA